MKASQRWGAGWRYVVSLNQAPALGGQGAVGDGLARVRRHTWTPLAALYDS